jgi:glycosyltransferase involved in cell wall biosynthesis
MTLSILIPTLESRREQFRDLSERLTSQIRDAHLEDKVEVLYERDDREASIGAKRNALVTRACGLFVAFVDDDDDVSDDYVATICEVVNRRPDIDCIGIKGIITFRGGHPHEFSHSLKYRDYFSRGHKYFRPPYHLNPIRRAIAIRFPFRPVSYSEDVEWALRLNKAEALQREEFIDKPLYFYKSRRWWVYQLLLDWSEPVRHALGLKLVNRPWLSASFRSGG